MVVALHFARKLHILFLSLLARGGLSVGGELLDKVRLLKVIRSLNLLGIDLRLTLSFCRLRLPGAYNRLNEGRVALGILLRWVPLDVGVVG